MSKAETDGTAGRPPAPRRRAASGGIKKRDPERTTANILRAAIAEFAAKGFGGARVDVIAKRSGANKRMLYHYFGNKEALFVAALEHVYGEIRGREAALHLEDLPPIEAMRRFVAFTFHYFRDHPHFISLLNTENLHRARHLKKSPRVSSINHPMIDRITRILSAGCCTGVFRTGIDPVQLYISVAGVSYFYFSNAHTLSVIFERDLLARPALDERLDHVQALILGFLRPESTADAPRLDSPTAALP